MALCLGAVWLAEARPEAPGGHNYRGGNSRGGYSRSTGGGGQDYVSFYLVFFVFIVFISVFCPEKSTRGTCRVNYLRVLKAERAR